MKKKPTMATVKSFIRKNIDNNLLIKTQSKFDGMTDCCELCADRSFKLAVKTDQFTEHTKGIVGAWFVGRSRDHISRYEESGFVGFEIYNCCGHFTLAIKS